MTPAQLTCILLPIVLAIHCHKAPPSQSSSQVTLRPSLPDSRRELSIASKNGRDLFKKNCAMCHGLEGLGDGVNAPNLSPPPRNFRNLAFAKQRTVHHIFHVISQGGIQNHLSANMPAWGKSFKLYEQWDLVAYIDQIARTELQKVRLENRSALPNQTPSKK